MGWSGVDWIGLGISIKWNRIDIYKRTRIDTDNQIKSNQSKLRIGTQRSMSRDLSGR